jgi:ribonuclease HII
MDNPIAKVFNPDSDKEVGIDEAGRGALAGPVCIAGVILPKELETAQGITIRDSKKMSEKKRLAAAEWIKANATAWSCVFVEPVDIDRLNILNATLWGMKKAIRDLDDRGFKPDFIVVDGPHFHPDDDTPYECVSQGDDKYRNIAAASIIAKTERDELMRSLHEEFPVYNWKKNKAYGTREHKDAIKEHGRCLHHRKSFRG